MILALVSAAFGIGFLHSILAPAHWLPIVLLARAHRWKLSRMLLGALAAASGHIALSVFLSYLAVRLGAEFIESYEHRIETWGAIGLISFGLIYAIVSWFRHSRCHGHEHHGPQVKAPSRAPFLFLLSLGFSPCIAVVPVLIAASAEGTRGLILAAIAFGLGVIAALGGASILVSLGFEKKLDHPILEHYGDVFSGLTVAVLGIVFALLPHSH